MSEHLRAMFGDTVKEDDQDPGGLLYEAWVVIANAGGWENGGGPSPGWQDAAIRWRDKYHATLGVPRSEPGSQARCEVCGQMLIDSEPHYCTAPLEGEGK